MFSRKLAGSIVAGVVVVAAAVGGYAIEHSGSSGSPSAVASHRVVAGTAVGGTGMAVLGAEADGPATDLGWIVPKDHSGAPEAEVGQAVLDAVGKSTEGFLL